MGVFFLCAADYVMSQELTWQLIRKHNSFVRRRDGATFSVESNNLTNKHSFKYSGLANNNAVGVDFNRDKDGNIVKGFVVSTKSRKAANRRRPAKAWETSVSRKGFRQVARSIRARTEGQYYRRDLTNVALARLSQINSVKRV